MNNVVRVDGQVYIGYDFRMKRRSLEKEIMEAEGQKI